jgi:phosphatidylethanolamine-binding protein
MMDLDMTAPNATLNSSTTFTTFLNWLATDIDLGSNPITISATQGAPYFPPSPPSSDQNPHRYVFLLFAQPANFIFPSSFNRISPPLTTNARLGFDLASFATNVGLNVPVAADWITVQSGTSKASNVTITPKPTPAGNVTSAPTAAGTGASPKQTAGAARGEVAVGLLVGAALLALFA